MFKRFTNAWRTRGNTADDTKFAAIDAGKTKDMSAERSEMLTSDAYDAAEQAALPMHSIPTLMAFRPATFSAVGFPIRVGQAPELLRYIDHNFEAETKTLYQPGARYPAAGYRNEFSQDEDDLVQDIRARVADFTERRYGRRTRPMTNILVQVGPLRAMEALRGLFDRTQSETNVFEVGPGAGYFGAMLAKLGYRYYSYDVAQSLYLWQSHLLELVAPQDFCEYAVRPSSEIGEARVGHFAWWQFAAMLGGAPIKADIVYSNSNLGEMSSLALNFVLHIARGMLEDSRIGAFCYFSEGMQMQNSIEAIEGQFAAFGFVKAISKPFHCYVLDEARAEEIRAGVPAELPLYAPSGERATKTASDLVSTPQEEQPLDVQITQWLHGWSPP